MELEYQWPPNWAFATYRPGRNRLLRKEPLQTRTDPMSETSTPNGFSATDAGLVGFRILRQRPTIWPAWAIASLVVSVAMVIPMVIFAGPAMAEFQALGRSANPDPEELVALYGRMAPAFLLALPVSLAFYAVVYAAANRVVMRPGDGGFGWFRFGAQELRQGLALIVVFAILMGAMIAVTLAASILVAVASMVTPILGALVGFLALFAALGVMLYVGVRLSLVSPLAFDTGRVDVAAAWRLSKGRIGAMMGAFFLSIVMALIISAVGTGVFFLVAMPIFGLGDTAKAVFEPDMSSMASMFPPVGIAYYIWQAILAGVTMVVTSTVAPTIYRQITAGEPEVFD